MENYPATGYKPGPWQLGQDEETVTDTFSLHNAMDDDDDVGGDTARGSIFLNDITKVDCALFDASKGVVGQTWLVDVALGGPLGPNGFVFDFSLLKKMVREVLKGTLDHALLIPINSQAVHFKDAPRGECWRLKSRVTRSGEDCEWEYKSPTGSVFPSRCIAISRQTLEQEFSRSLRHRLPQEISQIVVALREEDVDPTEATFRYTHGIAGHAGMCQRLLHGHRSRIQIMVGEERRPDLEHYVARDVLGGNVHIATPSQFKSGHVEPGTRGKTKSPVTLGYEASQGSFELTLPADRVFCVSRETSIECIANEIAALIKREENTSDRVRVTCFEGIDKGAIAEV
jgi:6-pyruvoyl-tetrahydropterin synthase